MTGTWTVDLWPAALEPYATPLDELVLYPGNARTHDLPAITISLRAHGCYRPLVYRLATREIIAGNGTLTAMRNDGWTRAPALALDVDEAEAARLVLADNRLGELGRYDDAVRARLFAAHPGLVGTGYAPGEVASLLASFAVPDLGVSPSDRGAAMDAAAAAFLTTDERRIVLVHPRPAHERFHSALTLAASPGESAPATVARLLDAAHDRSTP